MKRIFRAQAALLAVAALCLAGCAAPTTGSAAGTPTVVATTTMLGDLAQQLGGEYITTLNLMGAGVDPHTYQASAGDLDRLRDADMILTNGLALEGRMAEVFEGLAGTKHIVIASDAIASDALICHSSAPDPHIWLSVPQWTGVARHVSAELASLDPDNAEGYEALLDEYLTELSELDEYIRARVSELPGSRRVLITSHDAFSYFGREYGFEVRGIQGINTSAEAGTAEISDLADFAAEREVPAVFVETSVSSKSAEALIAAASSRGSTLLLGGALYSDSLGDGENASYIAAMRSNIDTIITALSEEVTTHD